jgi:hypothetical protein
MGALDPLMIRVALRLSMLQASDRQLASSMITLASMQICNECRSLGQWLAVFGKRDAGLVFVSSERGDNRRQLWEITTEDGRPRVQRPQTAGLQRSKQTAHRHV